MQGLEGPTHKMNGKYHQMNEQIEQWDLDSIIRQKRKSTFKVHFCLACLLASNLLPGLISERGGGGVRTRGVTSLWVRRGCAPVLGSFWPENSGIGVSLYWKISVIGAYFHSEFSGSGGFVKIL